MAVQVSSQTLGALCAAVSLADIWGDWVYGLSWKLRAQDGKAAAWGKNGAF